MSEIETWAFRGNKGYEYYLSVNAGASVDKALWLKDWFPDLGGDQNVKLVLASIDSWLADNESYVAESAKLTIKSSNRSLDIHEFKIEQGASKTWLQNLREQPEMSMLDAIEMTLNNGGNSGIHVFYVQFQFLVYRRV